MSEEPEPLTPAEDPEPADPVRGPWPRDWMTPFLATLRGRANIREACEAAGVSRVTATSWRMKLPRFREAWDVCVQDAIDALEGEAWNRALNNTRADELLWKLLSSLRRDQYGPRVEIDVRVHNTVKEMADKYGLTTRDILSEVDAIITGTATPLPLGDGQSNG